MNDDDLTSSASLGAGPASVIVCVVLAALPLMLDPRLFDQWELPKATVLWLGGALALVVLMAEWLLGRRVDRIRLGSTGVFAVGFLAVAAAATALSAQPARSLFGDMGRYEGLLTFAAYAALFFVSSQTLSKGDGLRRLVRAVTVVAAIVSVYGIVQFLGVDPVAWPAGRFEEFRSFSTLGNPMYLGEYLALCLPVALGGVLASRGAERGLFAAGAAIEALCLATTVTRGSWLGGVVGIAVALWMVRRHVHLSRRRVVALTVSAVVIVGAGLVLMLAGPDSQIITRRLASTFSFGEGSTGTRLEIARASAAMVASRPVLGWGPDTYRVVYPRYATLQHYLLAGRDIVADNAHNYPLQLAATIGLIGLLLFSGLVVLCLRRAYRVASDEHGDGDFMLIAALVGGVCGYLVALLSGISIVAGSALLWAVLGVLAGRARPTAYVRPPRSHAARVAAVAALASVYVLAAVVLLQPYRADHDYAAAWTAAKQGRSVDEVTALFRAAAERAPYNEQYPLEAGFYFNKLAIATGNLDYRFAAIERFFAAQMTAPLETNSYMYLAATYLDLANATGMSEYRGEAIGQLREEIRLAPNFTPGYFLLGSAYGDAGDQTSAIEYFKVAVEKDPSYREAWGALARSYRALGDNALADEAEGRAAETPPDATTSGH